MQSTNAKDVAYIFRGFARQIHHKAIPTDPYFIQLSVACGKVNPFFFFFLNVIPDVELQDRAMVRTTLPVVRPSASPVYIFKHGANGVSQGRRPHADLFS